MDKLYAKRKAEGRCVTCGKPAAPKVIGRGLGIYCEDHQRRNQKKSYDALHSLPDEERRQIYRDRSNRFVRNNPGYYNGVYCKKKYHAKVIRRKRAGQCMSCQKPAAVKKNGKKALYCEDHLKIRRERYRNRPSSKRHRKVRGKLSPPTQARTPISG